MFQLNTYKNVEGGTVGRILTYYDLCDVKYPNNKDPDLDFSEFMTDEEREEAELRRLEKEEEERLREEEEERLRIEEEKRAKELEEERLQEEKLAKIKVYEKKLTYLITFISGGRSV